MAGIIDFTDGQSWMVKNRIFCRVISTVIEDNEDDLELKDVLQSGIYCHAILLQDLQAEGKRLLVKRILISLEVTLSRLLSGGCAEFRELDDFNRTQHVGVIGDLLRMVRSQKPEEG